MAFKIYLKLAVSYGFFLLSYISYADQWAPPSVDCYYSENKRFVLKVFPKNSMISSFSTESHGTCKDYQFHEKLDTTIISCYAVLYEIKGDYYEEIWKKELINNVAPLAAIVANDGKTIVTFDEWHSMGSNAMIVYTECGDLYKKYNLHEISPPEASYQMSVSSTWWRCNYNYKRNNKLEICFNGKGNNELFRTYSLTEKKFED